MLGWISTDFFARSPVMVFPAIALCLFVVVFTAAALRAFLQDGRHLERMARMPLEEDREVDHG